MSDDIGKLADEMIGRIKTTEELKHVPFEMYARVLDRAVKAEAELKAVLEVCVGVDKVASIEEEIGFSKDWTPMWRDTVTRARAALAPSSAGESKDLPSYREMRGICRDSQGGEG